ncbi:hypothetical protein DP939_09215 [Spongiactinospora rosea]|uniref:Uncharacterized protein n=1 Tax=Spongiactinospora rosea TaxID=2248750 RepID=A0A366M1E3_9ACTN|nr:hypothetical protein [Spongiactinospora rosea]RBQ20005.1 hypothetical protein DP939_09215 [Spongiactinospora rosea]
MTLPADSPAAVALPQWAEPGEFFAFLRSWAQHGDAGRARYVPGLADHQASGPSSAGRTWNAGLSVPFTLGPGASTTVRFVMTWWFANQVRELPAVRADKAGAGRAALRPAPFHGRRGMRP